MTVLGKLEQVPLREVWKHEASDFTQWLAMPDNIDLLAGWGHFPHPIDTQGRAVRAARLDLGSCHNRSSLSASSA